MRLSQHLVTSHMIDMLAKILILGLLATAVVANPVTPGEEEDDLPVYTEKVLPGKTTVVPKFGSKKLSVPPKKLPEKLRFEDKRTYTAPLHTTEYPIVKTTKAIRGNTRPVRRINSVPREPIVGYNDLNPAQDYEAPPPRLAKGLGVEYAPDVVPPSEESHDLVRNYQPRRVRPHVRPQSAPSPANADIGTAVGNAPQLRYAVAPQRFAPAPESAPVPVPAPVRDAPEYVHAGSSYDENPQPYIFGYELKDENGSTQSRKEQGDDHGNKRGSYGYTDGYGIYRQVEYVADAHGFRAVVKTNEPGTANEDPADVEMHSEADQH